MCSGFWLFSFTLSLSLSLSLTSLFSSLSLSLLRFPYLSKRSQIEENYEKILRMREEVAASEERVLLVSVCLLRPISIFVMTDRLTFPYLGGEGEGEDPR